MCIICDTLNPFASDCPYGLEGSGADSTVADPASTKALPGNVLVRGIAGTGYWSETPTPILSFAFADGSLSDHNFAAANWIFAGSYLGSSGNALNLEAGGGNAASLRADIRYSLDAFEDIANITFNESSNFQGSGIDLRFMAYNNLSGLNGVATFPGTDAKPSDGFESFIEYNGNNSSMSQTPETGAAVNRLHTVIHEIGHAIGLGHPHDTGNGSTKIAERYGISGTPGVYTGDNPIDNDRYSVMSYERGGLDQNSQTRSYGYAATPMALDVAAMHHLYGSRTNNTTNTTYTLTDPGTTAIDLEGSNGTVSIGRAFYSIWDTGGTDEIRYSGARNVLINLNEATLNQSSDPASVTRILNDLTGSSLFNTILPVAGGAELRNDLLDADYHAGGFFSRIFSTGGAADLGGYSIANSLYANAGHTTIIENATGSSGTDILIGNEQNNVLDGNSGDDLLIGGDGNDTLRGDSGDDELIGGRNADSLLGSTGSDTLDGGDGNDTLNGGSGVDSVSGGAGNDLIIASSGNFYDSVDGGSGTDTLDHSASSYTNNIFNFGTGVGSGGGFGGATVTLAGIENYKDGSGSNTIFDKSGAMTIDGGAGNDIIHENASGGADSFSGGVGDDTIMLHNGGVGFDVFDGGSGTDLLDMSAVNWFGTGTVIDLTAGTITNSQGTETATGFENAIGGVDDESINGTSGANSLDGGDGNDTLIGGSGGDTLIGGLGNDVLEGGFVTDSVDGGAGNDSIIVRNGEFYDSVDGGSGVDTLDHSASSYFGSVFDFISGTITGTGINGTSATLVNIEHYLDGAGANEIIWKYFSGGTVDAGAGDDTVHSALGVNETLDGGADIDTLDTTSFNGAYDVNLTTGLTNFAGESFVNFENLISGGGNDTLTGTQGSNHIQGGLGDDRIDGSSGTGVFSSALDTLEGGAGNDTLVYSMNGTGSASTYDGGADTDTFEVTGTASGRHVDLLAGQFQLSVGGANRGNLISIENVTVHNNNSVFGDGNANVITGIGSFDNLFRGGDGDDTILGGSGIDTLEGGVGKDRIEGQNGTDSIKGNNGYDKLFGGNGDDTIKGDNGNDTLKGQADNDSLIGGDGKDRLFGGSGDDTLRGGQGNDKLYGEQNADLMDGQAGNDTLIGGGGNDTLIGGGGNDELDGKDGSDVFVFQSGFGNDTIFGFKANNAEDIDLSAVGAITSFNDLITNHLVDVGGTAMIVAGANSIFLDGVAFTDVGAGLAYSAADFIF